MPLGCKPLLRYLLAGALGPSVSLAQEPRLTLTQFHHSAWTTREGAPANVYALAQTADGFLWLGTSSGLFRFDGVRFELFEALENRPMPSSDVSALLAVNDGLWIGYRLGGAGLLRHDSLYTF